LKSQGRKLSHFVCAVSGGGLMAGHALAIADGFPEARILGVEPDQADDFRQSRIEGQRVRLPKPTSICDGLLSYDVGEHNWPILKRLVSDSVVCSDEQTKRAMAWLYQSHGLRTEPSGAITTAALLEGKISLDLQNPSDSSGSGQDGDIVVVLSGRNIDEEVFTKYLKDVA
jgi:threonine dehydratase